MVTAYIIAAVVIFIASIFIVFWLAKHEMGPLNGYDFDPDDGADVAMVLGGLVVFSAGFPVTIPLLLLGLLVWGLVVFVRWAVDFDGDRAEARRRSGSGTVEYRRLRK